MTSEILLTVIQSFQEAVDAIEEGRRIGAAQIKERGEPFHSVALEFFAAHHVGEFSGHHLSRRESHKNHGIGDKRHQRK